MIKKLTMTAIALCAVGAVQADDVNVTVVQPALDADSVRYVLKTERRSVYESAMPLEGAAKEKFWNIYAKFEKDKSELDKKRIALLGEYVQKFSTMTNEQSMNLVKTMSDYQMQDIKMREKYAKMIGKDVSGAMGARFFQVDDYINSAVKLGVLGNMPLVGDKVSTKK